MILKQLLLFLTFVAILHASVTPLSPSSTNILSQFSLCPPNSNCCDSNTINVHGSATIQGTPDQAIIQASLSFNADTADQAIKKLTNGVNRIINILNGSGITADNYQNSNFNIYPNTSWANGVSTVVGQIASQSLKITIPTIAKDGSNIAKLIDSLATVNGIVINGLSFDITNKTSVYQQARQKAFQNAQSKAQDYAVGLNLSLGKLLNLIDNFSSAPVVTPRSVVMASAMKFNGAAETSINVGTISISYDLDAVYSFS